MFEDVRHRFPPSSSALAALSTLTPPSPILKSSEMSATWTSGSIPILLFDPEQPWRNSSSFRDAVPAQPVLGGLDTVVDMIESVENSPQLVAMDLGISHRRFRISEHLTSLNNRNQVLCGSNLELPAFTDNGGLRSFSSVTSALPCSEDNNHETELYNQETCIENIQHNAHARHCAYLDSTPVTHVNKRNPHVFHREVNSVAFRDCIPSNPSNHYSRKSAVLTSSLPSPIHARKSSSIRNIEPGLRDALPVHINDMQITILIDQEGFRTAQPVFSFVGYKRKRLQHDYQDTAQFRPSKRQSFHFHYGPFDGLPLLRRITVNGDDSRDFISRQAQLSLKDNGVYSIHGTEVLSELMGNPDDFDNSAFRQLEAAKLLWQFDYMVDDRLGKTMIGEKTLTPLTFSCSPGLVHPLQGKKINIIHILRKGLASKLVAEKLEPPPLRPLQVRPQTSGAIQAIPLSLNWVKIDIQATHHFVTKFHRRAQSQDVHQGVYKTSHSINAKGLPNRKGGEGDDIASTMRQPSSQRRRRASSVDEQ